MTRPENDGRLRLCLWYWGRHGGGAHYTLRLAEALAERDDVALSLSLSSGNELIDRFRRLSVPTQEVATYAGAVSCAARSALLPVTVARFHRFLRQHRVQAVDSTMGHLWTRFAAPAVTSAGARFVATVHDATLHPGEGGRLKTMLYRPPPSADSWIALTPFVARRLTEVWGIPAARVSVIPLGVLDYGQADGHGAAAASAVRREGPLRLLFLGRILPYKGLDVLAGAMRLLVERGVAVSLHVAGTGDLAAAGGGALRQASGVSLDLRWIADDEIPHLLAGADAVVLPYTEASQSGVVPTAFAAGVPAVVTPVGGLADQVRHEVDGLVAAAPTAEALAAALVRLAADRDLLARLAAQAASGVASWAELGAQVAAACRLAVDGDEAAT